MPEHPNCPCVEKTNTFFSFMSKALHKAFTAKEQWGKMCYYLMEIKFIEFFILSYRHLSAAK
jgi:hypothetical protein